MKEGGLKSVTELMEKTLSHIPDEILDAPPKTSEQMAVILGNGSLPAPFKLPDRLAQFEDRARGENERRRGSKQKQQQQQEAAAEASYSGQQQQPVEQQDASGVAVTAPVSGSEHLQREDQQQAVVAAVGA